MIKFGIKTTHLEAVWKAHFQLIVAMALGLVGLGLAFFGYMEMSGNPGSPDTNYRIVIENGDTNADNHIFSASDDEIEQLRGDYVRTNYGENIHVSDFGTSIAFANANLIAISSTPTQEDADHASVDLFEKDNAGQWQNIFRFSGAADADYVLPTDATQDASYSVAFNGPSTIAIGVPFQDADFGRVDLKPNQAGFQVSSGRGAGVVFIITKSGTSWSDAGLVQLSGSDGSHFGTSLSFSESGQLAVGAPGRYIDKPDDCSDATPTPSTPPTTVDTEDRDGDGVTTDTIDLLYSDPCAQVHLYEDSGGNWSKSSQQLPATASYEAEIEFVSNYFGGSVAFSGDDLLAVGAPLAKGRLTAISTSHYRKKPGAVYLFTKSGGSWSASQKLSDLDTGDTDINHQVLLPDEAKFGESLAFIDSDLLAVGVPNVSRSSSGPVRRGANSRGGEVFLFNRSGNLWEKDSFTIGFGLFGHSSSNPIGVIGRALATHEGMLAVGGGGPASQQTIAAVWGFENELYGQISPAMDRRGHVSILGLSSLRQTTSWRYLYIDATDDCTLATFEAAQSADVYSYVEATDIEVATENDGKRLCFEASRSSTEDYLATQPIDLSPPDLSLAAVDLTEEGVLTIDFGMLVRRINDDPLDEDWARDLGITYIDSNGQPVTFRPIHVLSDDNTLLSATDSGGRTVIALQIDVSVNWPDTPPTATAPLAIKITNVDVEDHNNNGFATDDEKVITRSLTAYRPTPPSIVISELSATQTISASDNVADGGSVWQLSWIAEDTVCDSQVTFATAYTEESEIRLEEAHSGQRLCFQSTTTPDNLMGYASVVIGDIDRTAPLVIVSVGLDSISATLATPNPDDATRHIMYVTSASRQCDSGTDFVDARTYPGPIVVQATHADQYFCFRATDSVGNIGYGSSGQIGSNPVITGIETTRGALITFSDTTAITVTFDKPVFFTRGPLQGGSSRPVLRLNTRNDLHARTKLRFKSVNGNQLKFDYFPQPGEYTVGVDTPESGDNDYLKVLELSLEESDTLTDADGNPAILEIPESANIPMNDLEQEVDLRRTELTVINPADLDSEATHRIFSAYDNWDENDGLPNNGYLDSTKNYVFEYFFTPVHRFSDVPSTVLTDPEQALASIECAINDGDKSVFSYVETEDIFVTDEFNDHYICFRSRRPGETYSGGLSALGFSGFASALIHNLNTPRPTVTVASGDADDSFKATDDYDNVSASTTWLYQFVNVPSECDGFLDWDVAPSEGGTVYTEGEDVPYTSANGDQHLCFRSEVVASDYIASYGASGGIVDTTAPAITSIEATSGSYGENQEVTITVTLSEEVTLDTANGLPQLVLDLSGSPVATYDDQPSVTTLAFSFTVRATDNQADLNVSLFDLNGSLITDAGSNNLDTGIPSGNNLADTSDVVLDTTAPTITVTPSGDDATAKQTITVSASSTDTDRDSTSWLSKIITSDAACDATTMADGTSTDTMVILDQESHNNRKVCFSVTDQADNTAYQASGVISGIDTTPPVITVTPLSDDATAKQTITVSASSTDTDRDSTSWLSKIITSDAACDATTMADATSTDTMVILDQESHNNHKVCFSVTDQADNTAYRASGVISGIDTTPPVITVTPSGDDATAKQTITVLASSTTDTDRDSTSWAYKLIASDAACDATTMADATSTDTMVILDQESHNNRKVCFSVTDQADNTAYQASGVISGIDTTPPTIDVSDVTNNQVSATVSDILDNDPDFEYTTIPSTDPCTAAPLATFQPYTTGTPILLPQNTKACFKATDNVGNVLVVASVVASPQPPPQPELELQPPDTTPPVITVTPSGDDATAKQTITVSASSTDTDRDSTSWLSKIITSDAACDATTMADATSTDTMVILDQESHNNHKVCFSVTDQADNTAYQASGVISGIDTTPPTIDVSAVTNNQVSATVSDILDNDPDFEYTTIPSTDPCTAFLTTFQPYTTGTPILLPQNTKACFKATDAADNVLVVASVVASPQPPPQPELELQPPDTAPPDTTPPVITVTPSGDDATAKQTITVSASSTDTDRDSTSWLSKIITSDAACDATTMADATSTDTMVILDQESHNNRKVCFSVSDQADNTAYRASGVISGIDTTPPTIDVSDVTNNQVSATVSDILDNDPSFSSQILDSGNCDANTADNFSPYTAGDLLPLTLGQKACFKATDAAANTAYAASAVVAGIDDATADTTAPRISLVFAGSGEELTVSVSDDDSGLDNASLVYVPIQPEETCDQATLDLIGQTNLYSYSHAQVISLDFAVRGSKLCFKATDNAGNTAFQGTKVISEDNTSPQITVTNDDTSPAPTKTFSASSLDEDVDPDSWRHKLYDPATDECGPILMSTATLGQTVTLATTSSNGQQVCFSVSDYDDNPAYQASGVISGIDTTPPTIDVSAVTNNQVSATVSDNLDDNPSLSSQILDSGNCDANTADSFSSYTAGDLLPLTPGQKACFKATDNAGNTAYAVSAVGADTTVPRSSDTTTTTAVGDDQTLPVGDAKPTEQTGSDTAQPAAASEISDLSDDGDSNTSTIIIGLLAIFVITILATRSRRNRSQPRR